MSPAQSLPLVVGRYALYDEIAAGGMATVHIGRLIGPVGFSRTVAIKRMHPNLSKDPEFVSMFLDEARLAARIRHPNVIGTLDVVALAGELFLVMEYVHGESLFRLMKTAREAQRPIPLPIASAVMIGILDGLHAAHEATNEREEPLGIVHRDVSPHNVIVGAKDGLARVLDFGIAKAADRAHSTRDGQIKGKLSYMAPEQLATGVVDRTSDVYSASVILWEAITGRRLFPGESELRSMVAKVLEADVDPPSLHAPGIPPELDALVLRGLEKDHLQRIPTARDMARALQRIAPAAPASDVAEWVESTAGAFMDERARRVALIEQTTPTDLMRGSRPPSRPPPSVVETVRPSEGPTLAGSEIVASRNRSLTRYFAAGVAALIVIVSSVIIKTTNGVAPAASAGVTALAPPPPSTPEPSGFAAAAVDIVPTTDPKLLAPASSIPSATLLPAASGGPPPRRSGADGPRRRAGAGGEFDHVMDSRK
jgi:serine/threonine protein kinase